MLSGNDRSSFEQGPLEGLGLRQYAEIAIRSKWLIATVTLLTGLIAAIVGCFIPSTYRATTVILVDPRKVPDSVVMSTVTSGVADRLPTLRQQVMSSTRLAQIIESMHLYTKERQKHSLQEVIERMRKDIDVQLVANGGDRGLGAFNISYNSREPKQASDVTNRLANVFIAENVKAREQEVSGTAEFIDRELDDARADLHKKEETIRDIKTRYSSSLPESQLAHVQAINSLQLELRAEMDAIQRAQQQKVLLDSNARSASRNIDTATANPEAVELAKQQNELDQLRLRYGPKHPDVIRLQQEVARLRQSAGEQTAPGGKGENGPKDSTTQVALLDQEMKSRENRIQEIRSQIGSHQQKIDRMPVLEQQLSSVMRDYDTAREHYKTLLDRKFAADMSSNLETYQKGERFVILDPAQPPTKPFWPNRRLLDAAGLAVGLALGLVLAVFLELNNHTVKSESEIRSLVQAPILVELPWLETPRQERRDRIRTGILALANSQIALGYIALFLFKS